MEENDQVPHTWMTSRNLAWTIGAALLLGVIFTLLAWRYSTYTPVSCAQKTFQRGDNSQCVEIGKKLMGQVSPKGLFDDRMLNDVLTFQANRSLSPTGKLDVPTWTELCYSAPRASSGQDLADEAGCHASG